MVVLDSVIILGILLAVADIFISRVMKTLILGGP